jgi:hypothetical protein
MAVMAVMEERHAPPPSCQQAQAGKTSALRSPSSCGLPRELGSQQGASGTQHAGTASSAALEDTMTTEQKVVRALYKLALTIVEKVMGSEHPDTNRVCCHLSRLLLLMGVPTEALTLAETALANHDDVLGRDHVWTKESARVTSDALDALGRGGEAKVLRERHGLAMPEKPQPA